MTAGAQMSVVADFVGMAILCAVLLVGAWLVPIPIWAFIGGAWRLRK